MGSTTVERAHKYRQSLRASGLRPVQIWVPDARQPGFVAECRRQSALLQGDVRETEMLDWLAVASDQDGWV
jgi:hypothetical protein